jgi:small-conductance mechanosensitive channel
MEQTTDEDVLAAYRAEFGSSGVLGADAVYPKDSRIAKAYEISLDIRKFEIELYWKRAGYFWLLLAALAASLGVVLTAGSDQVLPNSRRETIGLFISCAATVLSICWMVVNRASKSWQRNWEFQVDALEDAVIGPLYKTVMYKGDKGKGPVSFSISDANFWISFYFTGLFFSCAVYFGGVGRHSELDILKLGIIVINVIFVLWFIYKTRTMQDRTKLRLPLSYTRRAITSGVRVDAL